MIRCLPRWRKTGGKCEDNGGDEDLYDDDNGGGDLYDWCRVIWAEACVAGGGGTGVYLHQVFVQVALFHQKNMYLHQRW